MNRPMLINEFSGEESGCKSFREKIRRVGLRA